MSMIFYKLLHGNTFSWKAPHIEGIHILEVGSYFRSLICNRTVFCFKIVENIPEPPAITGIVSAEKWYEAGAEVSLICEATNEDGGPLIYAWTFSGGTMISQNDSLILLETSAGRGNLSGIV
jgi:hypothetical protein